MPWSGFFQTAVAHSACAWMIGQSRRGTACSARVEEDRVEDGAVDVVLPLVEGAVSDPDGTRSRVAREVVERRLGQVPATVDPVHDLQRAVLVGLDVGDELHELVGLPVQVQVVQRLERERRVAHPRVAVVPVALATGRLGKRGRQRRDRRAGRHVRQSLDRECRALYGIAPAMVGDAGSAEPARARSARSLRGGPPRRRRPPDRPAPRPTTARSTPCHPPAGRAVPARGRPRFRARDRFGGGRLAGSRRVGDVPTRRPPASTSPGSRP